MLLTSFHKELIKKVRDILEEKVKPFASEIDREERFPQESYEAFKKAGLFKLALPKKYGGFDVDTLSLSLVITEIAKISPSSALLVFPTQAVIKVIDQVGTKEQKDRFFLKMKDGDKLCAFCLTEPNYGSDAGSLITKAELKGDHFIINGTKSFITLGPHAHFYLVFVRTGPGKRTAGISAIIVERDTEGLSFGAKEKKMGLGGSITTEMIFKNAVVPKENLLLNVGEGWKILTEHANPMRVWGAASMALGIAEGAFREALNFARRETQFGKRLARFQTIQSMLSDMAIRIEAARSLIYRTIELYDSGKSDKREIESLVSMAKCYASDMAMQVTIDAIQVLGYGGIERGSITERLMRDAKAVQIFDGSNQIQRMIVARNMLLV